MSAMTLSPHNSAVVRLAGARDEERRLGTVRADAIGTGAQERAEERLSAGHADVAAREQWLHWIDEGESLAPWADGEWVPSDLSGPHAETARVGRDLSVIRERIRKGELELGRAVAGTARRIEALDRVAKARGREAR
jgi:hypothetical protein